MEKWNSCYLTQFETIPIKWKEISNILSMKHNHEHVFELFKNSKKINEVWKSRDLSWCDGITRGCCDKKLRRFRTLYHDDVYKIETSHKKYIYDCIWELVDVFFEYKIFYIISYAKKKFIPNSYSLMKSKTL